MSSMDIHESFATKAATPVWIRIPEATRLFGLKRSYLYELVASGSIRSRILKSNRHALRGVRLLSYDSLSQFIENQPE